jgi:O-antigen/teichoic acid export membrane protein
MEKRGELHDRGSSSKRNPRTFLAPRLLWLRSLGLNFLLRLASLAGKFALSLYIARFMSLDELGLYGLVFSVAMLAVPLFGGRIDYSFARMIVTKDEEKTFRFLRDQSAFLLLNYLLSVPFLIAGNRMFPGSTLLFSLTAVICWLESYGNFLFVNTNFIGKSVLANVAFFVRSGLWSLLAIALGITLPGLRTLWFVLALWATGSALSILLNLTFLNFQRWPAVWSVPIDWRQIGSALRRSLPIWIASIGLVGGSQLDRFVLGAYLSLKAVGLATFYTSLANAVVTLAISGTLAVAAPRLISSAERQEGREYKHELRRAALSVTAVGAALSLAIALAIPFLAVAMHKPEIGEHMLAVWLLMGAVLIRLVAETAYYGLYARHKDRAVWTGNILFLSTSLLLNLILVPPLGFTGLGIASFTATVILLALRFDGLRSLPNDAMRPGLQPRVRVSSQALVGTIRNFVLAHSSDRATNQSLNMTFPRGERGRRSWLGLRRSPRSHTPTSMAALSGPQ